MSVGIISGTKIHLTSAFQYPIYLFQVLRDMLQMGCLLDAEEQLQAVSALRCTDAGMEVYEELKQNVLSLNHKSGPQSFTLAPNSTVSSSVEKYGCFSMCLS